MRPINKYLSNKIQASDIKATDDNIRQIVKDELDRLGHNADLNHIDVSEVINMYNLFSCREKDLGSKYKDLNPDISNWDVSNVENMNFMFYECKNFNCDISNWNVSSVENMEFMFYGCKKFNQDLSQWNVSKVINMGQMFKKCEKFNQDISGWDVNNVQFKNYIFDLCFIKREYMPKFN